MGRFNRATLTSAASMVGALDYGVYLAVVSGHGSANISTYLGRFEVTAWVILAAMALSAVLVWPRTQGPWRLSDRSTSKDT